MNNSNVIATIRRELRRIVDVLVEDDEILKVLRNEVVKRETVDDPEADNAIRRVNKAQKPHISRDKTSAVAEAPPASAQTTAPLKDPKGVSNPPPIIN